MRTYYNDDAVTESVLLEILDLITENDLSFYNIYFSNYNSPELNHSII